MRICENENCTGCAACINICPQECISMQPDNYGFDVPVIDIKKCSKCHLCRQACPILKEKTIREKPDIYAVRHKDTTVRQFSSSGAFIVALEEYVIQKHGFVFGVQYDKNFEAMHDYAISQKGCMAFRGSKYTQSKIGDGYRQVKRLLVGGKTILFTGTPCQIAGLYTYLNIDENENLITVQTVCHGVPSPKVFQSYVTYLQNKSGQKMTALNFRDKSNGWKQYCVRAELGDQTYKKSRYQDLMVQAFLSDICLRKSCYNCSFKLPHQYGDFTVGDFWGVSKITDRFSDNTGVNVCAVHSDKARQLLNKLHDNEKIEMLPVDYGEAFAENPSALYSVSEKKGRAEFFDDLDILPFNDLVRRYCCPAWHKRLKRAIKNRLIR